MKKKRNGPQTSIFVVLGMLSSYDATLRRIWSTSFSCKIIVSYETQWCSTERFNIWILQQGRLINFFLKNKIKA